MLEKAAALLEACPRARSHRRVALPRIHFAPDSLTYLAPPSLKRPCDRTLGLPRRRALAAARRQVGRRHRKGRRWRGHCDWRSAVIHITAWHTKQSRVTKQSHRLRHRVISDCHFRKTATEYDRNPGIKWLSCTVKWQSDIIRPLPSTPQRALAGGAPRWLSCCSSGRTGTRRRFHFDGK